MESYILKQVEIKATKGRGGNRKELEFDVFLRYLLQNGSHKQHGME